MSNAALDGLGRKSRSNDRIPENETVYIDLPREMLIRSREATKSAARAGQFAPTFRLPDITGRSFALIDILEQGPLVLSFYRGVWCDYCGASLEAFASRNEIIRASGATHVAICPSPTNDAHRLQISQYPMPVLVDRGLRVMSLYGLVFTLPHSLRDGYARIGFRPSSTLGSNNWLIPTPATYIITKDGRIALSSIDMDYRKRPDPDDLIAVVRRLGNR